MKSEDICSLYSHSNVFPQKLRNSVLSRIFMLNPPEGSFVCCNNLQLEKIEGNNDDHFRKIYLIFSTANSLSRFFKSTRNLACVL